MDKSGKAKKMTSTGGLLNCKLICANHSSKIVRMTGAG